ncbi:MAG: sulfatase [Bacteroidales bacterium]|nr:sulfatase [Bacteroidales bacterium]
MAAALLPQLVQAQQPYNVVFIMTDDHTAQMMSCYDSTHIRTPHLDRIARDGVRFTNSFVANSLSGPSRACMLTGKHSHTNGFLSNVRSHFDGSQQTMPKLLQKVGYQTALIGKWHLESTPTGFDYFRIFPGQGDYYNPTFIEMDGSHTVERGYVTNIVTDLGIDWLANKRDHSKPFILFLHHKACHRPFLPDLKHLTDYEDTTFKLPSTFRDDYAGRAAAAAQEMEIGRHMDLTYDTKIDLPHLRTPYKGYYYSMIDRLDSADRAHYDSVYKVISDDFVAQNLTGAALDEYKYQRYMRDYAKVVRSLDDNVGRLLDYLEAQGLTENTLIVYTSDQGFYMGEHGWFDKRFMYEESMRTPLTMLLPKGLNKRGDVVQMVQNIDYAPTFLDLAGAPIPSDIQGVSLLPLLKDNKAPRQWRNGLYYHFHEYPAEHAVKRHYGIRTERYKLIHFYHDIDVWELYDLKKDPNELNNLYGKPGTERLVKKLRKQLWQLQEQYDDPIRHKYPLK